ncbi:30S ribosomal protein S2 [Candidatus Poribacteria bacterium]|nr:30S ribosomal protein S2 [Candidatus Poribacteria bacterium]
MAVINMQELLKAGVHFGHQKRKWNPKMARYIFTERNGTYIIDLRQTIKMLREACNFLKDIVSQGEIVLFVGTKRQAADTIAEEAKRCGMYYVNERWLGGMLTNFSTIRRSIRRLNDLDKMESDGTFNLLPKKEVTDLKRQKEKLERNLSGIRNMQKLPGAVIIIDTIKEKISIQESNKLVIPSIAIVDTKCDPDQVTYPIPGNDDAIRSIKLVCQILADSIVEARVQVDQPEAIEEPPEKSEKAEAGGN